MREESQLDDMRAAIRGDFERLARRRGDQELMRVDEPGASLEPEQHPEPEPVAETDRPATVAEPDEALVEPSAVGEDTGPAPRSWLDRLRGR